MSAREWLIKKGGYFYRPNCAGYTTRKIEAGRYTKEEAEREAAIEPWHMSAIHQDEIADDPIPAGYRILAPGEMDRETLEAAAKHLEGLPSFGDGKWAAAAIRTLGGGEG